MFGQINLLMLLLMPLLAYVVGALIWLGISAVDKPAEFINFALLFKILDGHLK